MSVSVGFLGGLGEVGRNCALVEVDGALALVDCGLMFPEEDMLGVDLVLPDFTSVLDRRDDLACVILTHGHEDHIGALSYLLREVNVPVYGGPLATELARPRVEDLGITPDLRPVGSGEWVEEGPFRFKFIPVAHSVPEASAVVLDTPEGFVVHSGDFKLDPTPIDGVPTDLAALAELGREGVRLLLADSTNAERPGYVPSEATIGPELADIVGGAPGRVIVACFASHIHRVQQVLDAVVASGRRFAFLGRSMVRNTAIASELDLLDFPEEMVVELGELDQFPPDEVAIVCTGSQGEPYAALSLMAAGTHRLVSLVAGDTVVISATPIPGNETKVSRVINNLTRLGVDVYHGGNARVHVSGHAARDELKMFLNIVRPQAFVPVHGEYRHLAAHADLAREVAVSEVHVLEDGDRVVLAGGELSVERNALPAGYVYVDGAGLGDMGDVLRDRRHLADDGVLIVSLGVEISSGDIIFGPDVDSHGVHDDSEALHDAIAARIRKAVEAADIPLDFDDLRRQVRIEARRAVRESLERRPVVLPVLVEV